MGCDRRSKTAASHTDQLTSFDFPCAADIALRINRVHSHRNAYEMKPQKGRIDQPPGQEEQEQAGVGVTTPRDHNSSKNSRRVQGENGKLSGSENSFVRGEWKVIIKNSKRNGRKS